MSATPFSMSAEGMTSPFLRKRAIDWSRYPDELRQLVELGAVNGDITEILEILRARKRFSVFEATEHSATASTLTFLIVTGRIKIDNSCGYPWTMVVEIDGEKI